MPDLDPSLYDYELPKDRIAQWPAEPRDSARLLVVADGALQDRQVSDLPDLLSPGDLVVVNDSRVLLARCPLHRATGGRVEVLFLGAIPDATGAVEALVGPSRRLSAGEVLSAEPGLSVELLESLGAGRWRVRASPSPLGIMEKIGHVPLPPYIHRDDTDLDHRRYQTVYARVDGSAAAPTAGLHFTPALLSRLEARGVGLARVTLHVGLATFRPLTPEDVARGVLHEESYEVPPETTAAVEATRARGGRVLAIGTTSIRALESATPNGARVPSPGPGATRLFIHEGYPFRTVDGFLTNFHLPRSSLLLLVAARLGRRRLLEVYGEAMARGYRFYSYGDAMLVL